MTEDIYKDEALTRAGYQEDTPTEFGITQKAIAEFIGVFALVFIGAGSIITSFAAGGEGGGTHFVGIAIAHGLVIVTMVSAVGHISGAHFNPAVTIAAFVTRKISLSDSIVYLVSQIAGGISGAAVLAMALPKDLWKPFELGTPLMPDSFDYGQGILIEAVLTFFLVWVIFATAVDTEGAFGKIAGIPIGFVVLMDILMGGPFTGAAMNPARSLGPALVSGGEAWTYWWIYWIGPILGAVAAAVLYEFVMIQPRNKTKAATDSQSPVVENAK